MIETKQPSLTHLTHEDRFNDILSRVAYKNWTFYVGGERGRWWMQVRFIAPDAALGPNTELEEQHGRKWMLSEHMTESEVVQTAFTAVLKAEEHEVRENFLVEGVAVLGPHIDLFALIAMAQTGLFPLSFRHDHG